MRISGGDTAVFFRALLMVVLFTFNTYLIVKGYLLGALIASIGIAITWVFNVSDVAVSTNRKKMMYILGATCGSAIALFFLPKIFGII